MSATKDFFYWNLEEAIRELELRQLNNDLVCKVNEKINGCPIPFGFNGFLVRHVATSREEDVLFVKRCKEFGLKPIFPTYIQDPFVSNNPSKVRIIRLYLNFGSGRKGGPRLKRVDLVNNMGLINGIPLCKIKTKWEEPLCVFHSRARSFVGLQEEVIDISDWLKSIGSARVYYKYLFVAFLVRGILFESFESPGFCDLDIFFREVVVPAWNRVKEEFDYYPLIVKHPDTKDPEEEKRILNWYPNDIMEVIPKKFRPF